MVARARIEPVGDRCLLIRLGDAVDLATNRAVHAVTALIDAYKPAAVIEAVPAFTTVAVHYQPSRCPREGDLPSVWLTRQIEALLRRDLPRIDNTGRVVEIPACYGGDFGPDLEDVARQCGLAPEDVISLHSGSPLTLYAFFFSPGNPFAGPLDPRLNVKRRSSPRTRVEAGSVAIANGLSSIYQSASPGGWNVIARTPWNLFQVDRQPPTRLRLGDQLRFKPISPDEFHDLLEPRP
ncbi:allophanate hydrolase subunit 1 [Achromobacter aloeverae]|uniref:Allophanate hydrolase subunit 1 n=1 Tax=Achromobacter aloeverae TaxID=1750518 RepID=A0A4Q1HQN8_9BURK|nr:allophanate hydrolase subunit 1 [Achromobacter aloeverae]